MIELRDLALEGRGPWDRPGGLNLRVPGGGRLLVTGRSGSGKTRLLKAMAGLVRPVRGEVHLAGVRLWPGPGALGLGGRVGFAFAQGGLLSNLSLRENIRLPLRFRGLPPSEVVQRTEAALDELGLTPVADLRPHAVSAAARKHTNLARVLVLDPEVILLDDPLEGLDTDDRTTALERMRQWADRASRTLVLAQELPGAFAGLATQHLDLNDSAAPQEAP